jgi:adenosylmethionine-8-amino-7-oxononanoate aminotransferase
MDSPMTLDSLRQLEEDARRFVLPHFASNEELAKGPKIFVRGEGCYLFDARGRRYLDTFASLLTTICGHRRPEVARAIREQLDRLEFFPNYVDTFTEPLVKLAGKIASLAPGDLAVSFFVNSGSEANETAIKMARQYFWEKGEKNRHKVLFRRFSYHGTTLGGVAATGIPWFREYFEPLLSRNFIPTVSARCYDCEIRLEPKTCGLRCLDLVEQQILWEGPDSIAALIMDPLPGSNIGFPVPPDGYMPRVRDLCSQHGILLIFDEIQTGFGKTGKMFVGEHWGVVPDIMTIGKGFSGGYIPLAAAVASERIASVFREPGREFRSGSTYGGHTLACAATLANIEIIEREDLVQNAGRMGGYLRERLEELRSDFKIAGQVSGLGLLQALFLTSDNRSPKPLDDRLNVGGFIRDFCYQHGIILRNNGDILVFAPALIIRREEIDEILSVLRRALAGAGERFSL